MNARTIAFIACRILALYVLVNYGLSLVGELIITFVNRDFGYALGMVFPALDIITAMFLWFSSGWISDQLTKSIPETNGDGLNIDHWKALCVAATGALFLLAAIRFMGAGLKAFFTHEANSPAIQELIPSFAFSTLLPLIIGFVLIIWGHVIVRGLNGFFIWANKPFFNEEEL